jgi:hypothetical protein
LVPFVGAGVVLLLLLLLLSSTAEARDGAMLAGWRFGGTR